MAQFDLHTKVAATPALNIQAISTDTKTVGNIIDTALFESLEFVLFSGTITTGVFTPLLEEGDLPALGDAAPVDAGFILGTYALATFTTAAADDNACKQLGYIGKKRYVRLSIVTTSTGNGTIGAVAVEGNLKSSSIDANT